jgi:glycerol-3-phosphate O-acyltransferase
MIATAIRLQEITKEAVHDDMTINMATALFAGRNTMTDEDFAQTLYQYSALLASLTTSLATSVLLTEEQLDTMIDEINEFDELGKDVFNGND